MAKAIISLVLLALLTISMEFAVSTNEVKTLSSSEATSSLGKRQRDEDYNEETEITILAKKVRRAAPSSQDEGIKEIDDLRVKGASGFSDPLCISLVNDANTAQSCECLLSAIRREDVPDKKIIDLIKGFEDPCTGAVEGGQTLLHLAVAEGRKDVVQYLISFVDMSLDLRDANDNTALDIAVELQSLQIADLLVEYGAEVSDELFRKVVLTPQDCKMIEILLRGVKTISSDGKISPIFHAIDVDENLDNVICLMHRLDMNVVDEEGRSPLLAAATKPTFDSNVYALIEALADIATSLDHLLDIQDPDRVNEIFKWARGMGNEKILKALLPRVDLSSIFLEKNVSPLHLAATLPSSEWLEDLLRGGADTELVDDGERTPLHFASGVGNSLNVRLLLQHGANIHAQDREQNSALHFAISFGEENINLSLIEALVEEGADLNAQNKEGETAVTAVAKLLTESLHIYSQSTSQGSVRTVKLARHIRVLYDTFKLLLLAGADSFISDHGGHSPMTLLPVEVLSIKTMARLASEVHAARAA